MADTLERRSFVECRAEADGRLIRGYGIVFDSLSEDLGGFKERIMPSAVDRTLRDGLDVRALIDHDSSKILGRTRAGTLRLEKDRQGLKVTIEPPDTATARDLMVSIKRGDISGMSFAFRTPKGGDEWDMEGDWPIRSVHDMTIREVSVVAFPAYADTQVAVRSLGEYRGHAWNPSVEFRERRLRLSRCR